MEEKVYYKIGEVGRRVGVIPHTIRYWEREFSFLKPSRNSRGQRLYTQKDVEKIAQLKGLLYQHGYRIAAAKRFLRSGGGNVKTKKSAGGVPVGKIIKGLKRLDRLLERMAKI